MEHIFKQSIDVDVKVEFSGMVKIEPLNSNGKYLFFYCESDLFTER